MPGPPPQPLALRILRGNPGKRALPFRRGLEPERPAELLPPPAFLVGYAADEWSRISGELHRLDLLSVLDTSVLAAYCQAYSHWRTAEETLAQMAERDPTTHGLLIKTVEGNVRVSPLTKISRRAASDMVRYAAEFGFSPAARARIAAGVHAQPAGKFDGLLGC